MRVKRADTKWNGVYFDTKVPSMPYRAWVKTNGRLIPLGRYKTPMEAVLAADFARYILWGIDPTKWYVDSRHRVSKPPNAVPSGNLPFNRQEILRKLFRCGSLRLDTMAANVAAYDEMAAKLSGQTV